MGGGVRSCRASFQFGCRAGRSCACSRRKRKIHRRASQLMPDRPFVLVVAGNRRPAHRRLERGGGSRRPCDSASLWPTRGRKRDFCRCAPSMPPPTMPRCAGLRCGRRAIRRPPRRGARRTAPTVFSSTSKARRICSAARKDSSPIFPRGCEKISACRRGLPSPPRPARPGRCRAFTPRPRAFCPRARKPRRLRPSHRSVAACAGNPHDAAPARLQNRRRASGQTARAVRRAFSRRTSSPSRPGARPRRRAARARRARRRSITRLRYLLEPIFTQEAVVASPAASCRRSCTC